MKKFLILNPNLLIIVLLINLFFLGGKSTIEAQESETNNSFLARNKSTFQEYLIKPRATEPKINDWLEPHYVVIDKSVSPKNKLFVFLPGSFGFPERQKLITQQAAKLGYHAINLRYPNSWTIGELCGKIKNPDCYGNIRLEILTGIDHSPLVQVNQANSIENRLVALLKYSDKRQPKLGLLQYIKGNKPRWESIVIAGHSQGGAEAFFIAKQYLVARTISFAAPADYNRRTQREASWLAKSSQTPMDRYYGFVHLQDPSFKNIQQAWSLLGLGEYGGMVNVDTQKPPYNYSHQLTTSAKPQVADKYHGSVVTDQTTPRRPNGNLLFQNVWIYLLDGAN